MSKSVSETVAECVKKEKIWLLFILMNNDFCLKRQIEINHKYLSMSNNTYSVHRNNHIKIANVCQTRDWFHNGTRDLIYELSIDILALGKHFAI